MSEGRAVQARGRIAGRRYRGGTGGVAIFSHEAPGGLRGVGILGVLGEGVSGRLRGAGTLGDGAAGAAGAGAGGLS